LFLLIGAWITTHAGWEWNFFINLPIGLLGVVLVASFVPHAADEGLRPFDLEGFLLTGSALSLTLAGLGASRYPRWFCLRRQGTCIASCAIS